MAPDFFLRNRNRTFEDFETIQEITKCSLNYEINVYVENTCTEFVYLGSKFMLSFMKLSGLSQLNAYFFGFLNSFILLIILASYYDKLRLTHHVFPFLILLSPPIWLLLDKANLESFIFFLVSLSGFLLAKRLRVLAWTLLVFCSLWKFFPAPLMFLGSLIQNKVSLRIILSTLSLAITFFLVFQIADIEGNIFPGEHWSFGIRLLPNWTNLVIDSLGVSKSLASVTLLSFAVLSGILFLLRVFWISSHDLFVKPSKVILDRDWVTYSSLQFGFLGSIAYFAGSTFDYRLIYWIVFSLFLLKFIDGHFSLYYKLLLIICFWCSCPFRLENASPFLMRLSSIVEILGDLGMIFFALLSLRFFYFYRKQISFLLFQS